MLFVSICYFLTPICLISCLISYIFDNTKAIKGEA